MGAVCACSLKKACEEPKRFLNLDPPIIVDASPSESVDSG